MALFLGLGCGNKSEMKTKETHHKTATYWITNLQLEKHPEGGYYRRTYESKETIPQTALPDGYNGKRFLGTAIYFLLDGHDFSAFHKLKQDEMWHFYEGSPIHIHTIDANGNYKLVKLGRDIENGECLQYVVPGKTYFASEIVDKDHYALVGCTVIPGFDFEDFEMPPRKELIAKYPEHEQLITRLTR